MFKLTITLFLQYVYRTLYEKCTVISNRSDFILSETLLSSGEYAVARYRRSNGDYNEDSTHLKQMHRKFKPVTPELFTNYYYILLRKNSMHTYELQRLVQSAEESGLMKFWEEDVRQGRYLFIVILNCYHFRA